MIMCLLGGPLEATPEAYGRIISDGVLNAVVDIFANALGQSPFPEKHGPGEPHNPPEPPKPPEPPEPPVCQ
jgi:hypothetical protein